MRLTSAKKRETITDNPGGFQNQLIAIFQKRTSRHGTASCCLPGYNDGSSAEPIDNGKKTAPLPAMTSFFNKIFLFFIMLSLCCGFYCRSSRAEILITPGLSLGHTYTDNLYLTEENEEYDYITTVTPAVDISLTGRRCDLTLGYAPSYAFYDRFPENDTLRHEAEMTATLDITSRTRLEGSDFFLHTETPVAEYHFMIEETETTLRRGRDTYHTNTAAIDLIHDFGPENQVDLGFEHYFLDNNDPALDDSEYHRPFLRCNYWPSPNRVGIEWEARYTRHFFDQAENYEDTTGRLRLIRRFGPHVDVYGEYTHEWTNYAAEGTDYQIYSPLLGLTWHTSSHTTLTATAGAFIMENEEEERESGPTGSLTIEYAWPGGSSLTISGLSGYDRAYTGDENLGFYEFHRASVLLLIRLTRNLTAEGSGEYLEAIYTEVEPEREDILWRTGLGLTYLAFDWMSLAAHYHFRQLDSDLDFNDYTENRGVCTISLMLPRPWRL